MNKLIEDTIHKRYFCIKQIMSFLKRKEKKAITPEELYAWTYKKIPLQEIKEILSEMFMHGLLEGSGHTNDDKNFESYKFTSFI